MCLHMLISSPLLTTSCVLDVTVPGPVEISSLVPSTTTMVVNVNPPLEANGVVLDYIVAYSTSPSFIGQESQTFNASSPDSPILKGLDPFTRYYVKVS